MQDGHVGEAAAAVNQNLFCSCFPAGILTVHYYCKVMDTTYENKYRVKRLQNLNRIRLLFATPSPQDTRSSPGCHATCHETDMTHALWLWHQGFAGRIFVVWEWRIPLAASYYFWLGVLTWEPESPLAVSCNFLVGGFSSIHLGCVADQRDEGGHGHAAAITARNVVGDKSSKPPST